MVFLCVGFSGLQLQLRIEAEMDSSNFAKQSRVHSKKVFEIFLLSFMKVADYDSNSVGGAMSIFIFNLIERLMRFQKSIKV